MPTTCVNEAVQNCQAVMQKVVEIESLENSKLQMLLMGFVAAVLSPLFIVLYVTQGAFKIVTTLLPLVSIFFVLLIGLPVITVFRWIYTVYSSIFNLLLTFYMSASDNSRATNKISS